MIKKTVAYTDYNGNEREETFYFNLTKKELRDMENSVEGGLVNKLKSIVTDVENSPNDTEKLGRMLNVISAIILSAYGEKSDDGKRFIKRRDGRQLSEEFEESAAYEVLFEELISSESEMSKFIVGMLPSGAATSDDIVKFN